MQKIYFISLLSLLIFGCASQQVGPPPEGMPPVIAPVVEEQPEVEPLTKYSDLNNMAPPSDRNYRRMTRKTMEDEAELQASAGSLWVMEGQTSFLFAQNNHHDEGDPTAIKMEGTALKQIESKVAVIQDLLTDLEAQKIKAEEDQKNQEAETKRLAELEQAKKVIDAKNASDPTYDPYEGKYPPDPSLAARAPAAVEKKPEVAKVVPKIEVLDLKEVENIPSRIVEKTKDGMYRIRGQQFLTIKKRPYKVIATALVRPEDFNMASISSTKLVDPQYDVIHIKKVQ